MNKHLVILKPQSLAKILNGSKTIESRFGIHRPPAWKCQAGDVLFLKETGGNITATAEVVRVDRYHDLDTIALLSLQPRYARQVHGRENNLRYWLDASKRGVRYAVFIHLTNVKVRVIPASDLPRNLPYASAWITPFEPPAIGQLPLPQP